MLVGIIVAVCAILVAGCSVAETIMYPDDGYENVTVNTTVNMTNNTTNVTNNTTNVSQQSVMIHTQPRGIIHRITYPIIHHDPFKHPDEYGVVTTRNGLWIKDHDGDWVKVARLNSNREIIEEYTNDPLIHYLITRHHKESPDCIHHLWYMSMFGNDTEMLNDLNLTDLNDTNLTDIVDNNGTISDLDLGNNSIDDTGETGQDDSDSSSNDYDYDYDDGSSDSSSSGSYSSGSSGSDDYYGY